MFSYALVHEDTSVRTRYHRFPLRSLAKQHLLTPVCSSQDFAIVIVKLEHDEINCLIAN